MVQVDRRCLDGWDGDDKVVWKWNNTVGTWNGETYAVARHSGETLQRYPLSFSTSQVISQVCLWSCSTWNEHRLQICPFWSKSHAMKTRFLMPFKVRSFCLSSKVQVDNGLEERDLDFSVRRRRFAGALGVALVFGLRLAGVEAVVESFDGSGRVSGGGAATCWCGSGRLGSTNSSIRASSSARSGEGTWLHR